MTGIVVKSGLLKDHIKESTRRVLLAFQHGLGDVLSFRAVFKEIKNHWPAVHFDLGLNRSMGYEKIVPEAILVSRIEEHTKDYDIVFIVKYHMEDFGNKNQTKSEKCCIEEIGIPPVASHVPVKNPPLVSVHFNSTCMPDQLGCPEKVATQVWNDIILSRCSPIETHFVHKFHNPENGKFNFVDMNCRSFSPRTDHLSSIIGSSFAFIGVASGNLHLALSLLPPEKIFMLTNRIKSGQITKLPIASCSVYKYNGQIREWLNNLTNK